MGEWTHTSTSSDGETLTNVLVLQEDGVVTIDMGSDGEMDIVSDYTIEEDKITVTDTMEESPCYGISGIYHFEREGDSVTLTPVDDECEARRMGAPKTMTLVE
ncbi:MAG: hypothetical protein WA952_05410 [Lewinella sp.]